MYDTDSRKSNKIWPTPGDWRTKYENINIEMFMIFTYLCLSLTSPHLILLDNVLNLSCQVRINIHSFVLLNYPCGLKTSEKFSRKVRSSSKYLFIQCSMSTPTVPANFSSYAPNHFYTICTNSLPAVKQLVCHEMIILSWSSYRDIFSRLNWS